MTRAEFSRQVFAVVGAIQDAIEADPPTAPMVAPRDWTELRSIARAFAEDLMLAANIDSAIAKLKAGPATLLAVVWLTTDEAISDRERGIALERAYEEVQNDMPDLLCYAFCSYLIELCDGLEIVPKPPEPSL